MEWVIFAFCITCLDPSPEYFPEVKFPTFDQCNAVAAPAMRKALTSLPATERYAAGCVQWPLDAPRAGIPRRGQ